MNRPFFSFSLIALMALSLFALLGAALPPAVGDTARDIYLVELIDAPLALRAGDGTTLDLRAPEIPAQRAALDRAQTRVLAAASRATGRSLQPLFRYQVTYNGLALALTPNEAADLAALPGVAAVHPPAVYEPLTDAGPDFVEADLVWDGSGTGGLPGTTGAGVVVGVIDTGIDVDHRAFAAVGPVDGHVHTNPWGAYAGICAGEPGYCSDKLIGYWDFSGDGITATNNSHGTHVASIAAGNVFTAAISGPTTTITPTLSGVAPHANVVAYDACAGNSCTSYMLVAAIEQATIDGVDVINYSIGGPTLDPWRNPITRAFLGARAAGVFVAAAAGNGGAAESIAAGADAPWLIATGNLRHDRLHATTVLTLSGGDTAPPATPLVGNGYSSGYGPAPIVLARAVDLANAQCRTPFAPGTFSDVDGSGVPAIVVCEDGGASTTTKAQRVAAGGAGGLLALVSTNWTYDIAYVLPAVVLFPDDAATLLAWVSSGSEHWGTLGGHQRVIDPALGDHIYSGSSRGANSSVPDVIKPDIAAPGYVIYGAVAGGGVGRYIGTSQASPHVAGGAALLRSLHPGWSAAELQSALMSTAVYSTVTGDDWVTLATPLEAGAGRLDVARAARAALLFDETPAGYAWADPALGGDPAQINLASLGNGACVESCSWTRRVRSAAGVTTTWTAAISAPAGIGLTVTPATMILAPGATATFTVTAVVDSAPAGVWAFGRVLWREGSAQAPEVHLPLALRPAPADVPAEIHVQARRDAGSVLLAGLTGPEIAALQVAVHGLAAAAPATTALAVDPTPGDPYDNLNDGTTLYVTRTLPAGTAGFAAEILASAAPDVDLYLGRDVNEDGLPAADELVCAGEGLSWVERCRVDGPPAGVYWVVVQNVAASPAGSDALTLATAVLSEGSTDFVVFGPTGVTAGVPFDLRLQWLAALGPGTTYFAAVDLGTAPGQPADLGRIWVRLDRLADDVTQSFSAAALGPADELTVTVNVAPNTLWQDAGVVVTTTVPAGLSIVAGSAAGGAVEAAGQVLWQGTMPRGGATPHVLSYRVAVDEAVCRQPAGALVVPHALDHVTTTPGSLLVTESFDITIEGLAAECPPFVTLALTLSDDGSCGAGSTLFSGTPTTVTYCFTLTNSSPVTVAYHTLTDSVLGPLLEDDFLVVAPGAARAVTTTLFVSQSAVHHATWTAVTTLGGPFAVAEASAQVTIGYALHLPIAPWNGAGNWPDWLQ